MRTSLTPPNSSGTDPEDFEKVIDVARAALDQQFAITQLLDGKARGQITIAGAWFAVVQAVAGTALAVKNLDPEWVWWIGGIAAAGAAALILTTAMGSRVWALRRDSEIAPAGLIEMANQARSGEDLDADLVLHYAKALEVRVANNAGRATWYRRAQVAWYFAMGVPLLELGVAFAARALG